MAGRAGTLPLGTRYMATRGVLVTLPVTWPHAEHGLRRIYPRLFSKIGSYLIAGKVVIIIIIDIPRKKNIINHGEKYITNS